MRVVLLLLLFASPLRAAILRVSPSGVLKTTLSLAQPGDTVQLDPGVYSGFGHCGLVMDVPNVELSGADAFLVCPQHLIVRGAGCVIRGVTFMHGVLGCVTITGPDVVVRQTAFVNCSSPTNGGALNIQAPSILLDQIMVMSSSAVLNGGGVYVVGTATVVDSNFRNNSAGVNGGAFWLRGGIARLGGITAFKHNSAGNAGGAIYVQDRGLIMTDDVLCDSNHATASGGCALAATNVTISGRAVIQGNSAGEPVGTGGGVQATSTGFYLTMEGQAVVRRNQAYTGGGLYARNFIMRGSALIEDNLAVAGGGLATLIRGVVDIRDQCVFRRNRAVSYETDVISKGAAINPGPFMTVLIGGNTRFESNVADQGGALFISVKSVLRIDGNVQFVNNVANDGGGAMFVLGTNFANRCTMVLAGLVILRNNSAGTYGGGIYAQLSTVTFTDDVRLVDNFAYLGGGGMHASQCTSQLSGRASFINNSATLRGGGAVFTTITSTGVYIASTAVIADDVVFSGNRATGGGAISSEDSTLVLAGQVVFRHNTANGAGGALFVVLGDHVSSVAVRNRVLFFNNSAEVDGGAAAVNGTQWTSECCARMEANAAGRNGGAMVFFGGSRVTLTSTSIVANYAHLSGGGVQAADTTQMRLENCTVALNAAGSSGGGLLGVGNARINVTRSTRVEANQAAQGGGAAVMGYALLEMADDSVLVNNTASGDGGGIFSSSAVVLGAGASVRSCSASRGGGIFSNGALVTLDGAVNGNRAAQDGGGVFLYGPASVSGSVRGNVAVGLGGGLFASGSDARLSFAYGTLVEANTAGSGGGLYLEDAAAMQVSKETCGCSGRNNGECNLDCMTRACNWDDGECSTQLMAPPQTCVRLECSLYTQTNANFLGCDDGCFSASCDWSRVHCSGRKAQLASCPLFDLAGYRALKGTLHAITSRGPRRCISQECAQYPEFLLNGTLDTSRGWVLVPWTDKLDTVRTDATLAFWLRGWDRGGLLWSPNLELAMTEGSLELRFQNRSKPTGRGLYANCSAAWEMHPPSGPYEIRITFKDGLIQLYVDGIQVTRTGGSCPAVFPWIFDGEVLDLNLATTLYPNSLVAQDGLAIGRSGGRVFIDGFAVWNRLEQRSPCRQALLCYDQFNKGTIADHGTGLASVGYAIANGAVQCSLSDEGGLGWCVGPRPNLPALNLGYDPADLTEAGLPTGCASEGVRFRDNQALAYGGAIFQAGCNKGLDGHGVCFFTGMSADYGATQVTFEHNWAGGGGGAVYTDCDVLLPVCTSMLTLRLGLPSEPHRARFSNNTASGYGPDIATAPSQLLVLGVAGPSRVLIPASLPRANATLSYVPGQQTVDLNLVLLDGLGTVVSGKSLPYVVTMLLCRQADGCDLQTALGLPSFVTLDTDVARTSKTGTTISCPGPNRTNVFALFYLSGTTTQYLRQTVRLECRACQAGQQRSRDELTWWCTSCLAAQYIVDPNRHVCRKCPQGARCDGSGLVGLDGSSWETIEDLYRLRSCPAGYILIRDGASDCLSVTGGQECKTGPELDHCFQCPGSPAPGRYSRFPATYPGPLVSATEAAITDVQCRACPKGANCEKGGNSVVPLPGYWTPGVARRDDDAQPPMMYKCLPDLCMGANQCQEGHDGFVCGVCMANYTHSGSTCVLCASEDSLRAGRAAGLTAFLLAFLVAWYFISIRPFIDFVYPVAKEDHATVSGLQTMLMRLTSQLKQSQLPIVMGIMKILLTFYQVTSCFWTAFEVPWPVALGSFFRGSTVTKGDIFTIPSFACLTRDWSRGDRLLFYTVTPPAITLLLGLPFAAARSMACASPEYKALKAKFFNATLVFLFLVYPMCSIAILDIYNCSRIESMYWLTNDLRLSCPMFEGAGFLFIWTVLCTALFPLGIPALMVFGLYYFKVPELARQKTEREALNAMLGKFQDDHKQTILDNSGADVSFCSLLFDAIDRRNPDGVWAYFKRQGKITLEVFTDVLVAMHCELRMEYSIGVLRSDAKAVFEHFDVDGNGELAEKEFASLTCALVESWHEDLTATQIDALVHHRWSNRVEQQSWLSRIMPARPVDPRTKLLRHCAYLVNEQILSVGKTYWNESPDAPEQEKLAVDCMGFLFLSYRVEYWYFELIEQLRKLLMTSVIVIFYPGSLSQLVGGIFITFMGLVLCFVMKPYMQPQLNDLQATCLSVQGITLFYGIILIAENISSASSAPTTAMTQIILSINIGLVLVPFLQFFLLRPPPFGERALWERILDAVLRRVNVPKTVEPRRRRSSIATTDLSYYKPADLLTGAA